MENEQKICFEKAQKFCNKYKGTNAKPFLMVPLLLIPGHRKNKNISSNTTCFYRDAQKAYRKYCSFAYATGYIYCVYLYIIPYIIIVNLIQY